MGGAAARSAARRSALALLLTGFSGFAALGYQIVWTQQCALWLGHEAPAVLAVITAFFAGLSVGALALGRRIGRSTRPWRWYVACEAGLALWALLAGAFMQPASAQVLALIGAAPEPLWQWGLSFLGVLALLLPATVLMGATLPAMQRVCAGLRPGVPNVAALYAANTAGAVLGVLGVSFWAVPVLGLSHSLWLCAALSLGCALVLGVVRALSGDEAAPQAASHEAGAGRSAEALAQAWRLGATGLLGIGFEVLVVRVLSQVAEDTVYTYALLLAVYLLGSAAGAAGYRRLLRARASTLAHTDGLLLALAAACLLGTASLWFAEDLHRAIIGVWGQHMLAAILAEAVLALVAFTPATVVMGALFSHLAEQALRSGIPLGIAIGVNTLGCALAPCLFGVVALPAWGPKQALLAVCAGYLLIGTARMWRAPAAWMGATALLLLTLLAPPLAYVDVPPGGRLLHYEDGIMASVSVVQDAGGVARLRIDNRQQEGSSGTRRVDSRQALLPLLLHPAPRAALFLGLGTGVTAASAAREPGLRVDVAELLPEVLRASRYFIDTPPPGLHIVAADARRYVRVVEARYDLIVADNFHPARSGAGSLYTVEHFEAIRKRLQPGGLFCQWLPLHQLDLETFRSILRSFVTVYPQGWALLANYGLDTPVVGLVARTDGARFDADVLRHRLDATAAPLGLVEAGIEDPLALFGSFIAGPQALARFSAAADLNTDDRPIVSYRAPRMTYEPSSQPRERLIALLQALSIEPDELLASPVAAAPRLRAYWRARDRFIDAGREVRPSNNPQALLAQVRAPLLAVLDLSPDFRPAYEPLLRLAAAIAPQDPAQARALLNELILRQPERPEAGSLLKQIEGR